MLSFRTSQITTWRQVLSESLGHPFWSRRREIFVRRMSLAGVWEETQHEGGAAPKVHGHRGIGALEVRTEKEKTAEVAAFKYLQGGCEVRGLE